MNKWNLDGVNVDMDDNMTVTGDLAVTGDLSMTGGITGNVSGYVIFPSTDPLVAGAWWDDSGTLTKSTGS